MNELDMGLIDIVRLLLITTLLVGWSSSAVAQGFPVESAADREKVEQEGLPLVPGRQVRASLSEGSWISLDVSPDGEIIVFDLLGDLYTMPFGGGRATPLTQGMAFDAQPRFSPDGERVVYTSDRDGGENVWIMSLDKSDTVQVTRGKDASYQSPEWTLDGDYVLATKRPPGAGRIWMYHVDGGSGIEVTEDENGLRSTGAAFGTDGRYIWFAQRTGSWEYNSDMGEYELAVYDRESGETASRSNRYGGAFRPTLSPDGRWLVYGTRHVDQTALRIRDLLSGAERWLAHPVQRDEQESRAARDAYPGMSFTPDSREVVASYGGRIWRVPVDGSAAVEIPFGVEVNLPIGPSVKFQYEIQDSPTFIAKQIRDATPSPDGERLAFTVLGRLYVMDYPGGLSVRIAEDLDAMQHHPTWSPDGDWIAFGAWRDETQGHLYKVRSNGRSNSERLTTRAALYRTPQWSPDGSRILSVRGSGRAYEEAIERGSIGEAQDLVWVSVDGGEATLITPMGRLSAPHFTRDPDRIYATSGGDGLISMRWDGTDRKGHVKVTGGTVPGAQQPERASFILMAPTGDQALAQVVNDLYVVTVPVVGGDAPTISVDDPENSSFPTRKLTDIGGEFPAWASSGRTIHWSIGNAHVVYDLDAAETFEDSVASAEQIESGVGDAQADTTLVGDQQDEDVAKYRPPETRIEIQVDRDIPQGLAVLRGARVITMRGDEVLENADILVRGNRIAAVGISGSVEIPIDADVLDVTGKTIVPGFVDTHAHLRAALGFHRTQPWSYAANLAYGVTTARDPQTGTTDVLSYEDRVRAGLALGPRIYSTGPGVFASERIRSLDHAKDVLSRYSDYYNTKTIKMYGAGNREQRQWIIDAARQLRLMPTTEGSLDLKLNLTMAIDGYSGTEHNLPGVPLYDDVVQLVAQSQMATTPTILVTYGGPWAENYFYARENVLDDAKLRTFTPFEEIQLKALRRPGPGPGPSGWFHENQFIFTEISDFIDDVVEAGGQAGVGSHGQLQGLGYHWELWLVGSSSQMTEHEALAIATLVGARSLGLDGEVGSIEVGKLADLVVLDRNPLEDLRHSNTIDQVMKNGRLYEGESLDEVWPRNRKAGPFYWQNDGWSETRAGIR